MDLLRLNGLAPENVFEIFSIADDMAAGAHSDFLRGKTVVMFFPAASIRTRVSFEKAIYLMGGQCILFPTETLDKKEDIRDVCGYLDNWADCVVVRHSKIELLEAMADCLDAPLINAMTSVNHPCEILTDMYSLSKIREDFRRDKYLFVGKCGNIGLEWKNAAEVMGFELEQCCGKGYEIPSVKTYNDIYEAIAGKDVICTDCLSADVLDDFKGCQVTLDALKKANSGAVLDPCPPFYRGKEVSADAIDSEYFVGYGFKKALLEVQQAIIYYCMTR